MRNKTIESHPSNGSKSDTAVSLPSNASDSIRSEVAPFRVSQQVLGSSQLSIRHKQGALRHDISRSPCRHQAAVRAHELHARRSDAQANAQALGMDDEVVTYARVQVKDAVVDKVPRQLRLCGDSGVTLVSFKHSALLIIIFSS